MEGIQSASTVRQLSDFAAFLPAISSTTSIKAYYDSSDKLLTFAEKAHNEGKIDEEYVWLMKFALLITERMPTHAQYNKSTDAQKLNKVYRRKTIHVVTRLEVLRVELEQFFIEKAARIAAEAELKAISENPKDKVDVPTEDQLLARLSRLNSASSKTPVAEAKKTDSVPEPQRTESTEVQQPMDFSMFEKPRNTSEYGAFYAADDNKLIPDVEIADSKLDLSWLESDPTFGSKYQKHSDLLPSTASSSASTSDTSSVSPSSTLPSAIEADMRKSPPSYSSAKSSPKSSGNGNNTPAATAKYTVVTEIRQDEPPKLQVPSTSPFSVPVTFDRHSDFSITRTIRGQQFDPEAMNRRLLDTTVGATCSAFIGTPPPDPTTSPSASPSTSPSPSPSSTGNSSALNAHVENAPLSAPITAAPSPPPYASRSIAKPSSLNGNAKTPSTNQVANGQGQKKQLAVGATPALPTSPATASHVPMLANIPAGYAPYVPMLAGANGATPHLMYQQAKIPLLGNAPVVFRPNHLNMFDPAKLVVPGTSVSAATSSSERPPKYKTSAAVPPSTSKPLKTPSTQNVAKPTTSAGIAPSSSSAFPLLTNQRPGAAVEDLTLRRVEMDGDMFDRFMESANKNTIRSIETCGILAGKFLPKKQLFRVTHLIIPKQTGTTDTCATTNEDEIFEYQIKHDLLTLGWIHTHPTQACFLSSVDLHTHSSYQALFAEAVAVVIAPRDTPNFAFFHLSKNGLSTVQNCPLKGFHHHPERGLYEACSHVTLTWNSKKPCKLVDMR